MIPKIIHYCWFGNNPLPDMAIKCIESWRKHCPEYEIIQWNESNFNINFCNYVKEAYEAKKWAFVSDYARLKIIYDYGGIYLDTDVELINSLDSFLTDKAFFGFERSEEEEKFIATGLGFGAEKEHYIVKAMLDDYNDIHFKTETGYDLTTCPRRNTLAIKKYNVLQIDYTQKFADFSIYSSEYFCPTMCNSDFINITDNTVSIHHFTASWIPKTELFYIKLSNKIINLLGYKIGSRLSRIIDLPYRVLNKFKILGIKGTLNFIVTKRKRK